LVLYHQNLILLVDFIHIHIEGLPKSPWETEATEVVRLRIKTPWEIDLPVIDLNFDITPV
jgi:hypothetical protein